MANGYASNVIFVDTSAAFTYATRIRSIKYIGASSGTATIKSNADSSGQTLWQESGTSNVYNPDVCIYDNKGVYVTLTNSAAVYLYLE
jgi:hypothetical protein